jgi:hypothetical protein
LPEIFPGIILKRTTFMVTIIGYKPVEKEDGSVFFKLQLQGGAEAVMSQSSNRWYLTARTCSITTTFDEETCKRLIGSSLKGTITKVESDQYDYTVPETGEVISLTHRWEYDPFGLTEESESKSSKKEMSFA